MSRKTTPAGSNATTSKKRGKLAKYKGSKTSGTAIKTSKRASSSRVTKPARKTAKKATTSKKSASSSSSTAKKQSKKTAAKRRQGKSLSSSAAPSSEDILAKVEADLGSVIESLNQQMSTAMTAMTELAVSHQQGHRGVVVRTAPMDRATATFQRLVAQIVEEQVSEMLIPVITLREEFAQRAIQAGACGEENDDFSERGITILDQVLASAHVSAYHARAGETFDPLIHLAVGETNREDLKDGAVAEPLRPGFRTAGGKVIVPAKIKVNRR